LSQNTSRANACSLSWTAHPHRREVVFHQTRKNADWSKGFQIQKAYGLSFSTIPKKMVYPDDAEDTTLCAQQLASKEHDEAEAKRSSADSN
jgi:hypothetical protein